MAPQGLTFDTTTPPPERLTATFTISSRAEYDAILGELEAMFDRFRTLALELHHGYGFDKLTVRSALQTLVHECEPTFFALTNFAAMHNLPKPNTKAWLPW